WLNTWRPAEALWYAGRVFFAGWDVGSSQLDILNLLSGRPGGCTPSELSRSLITHRSNVTGLVDRRAARGLVQRRDSAKDRRAYRVIPTAAGKRLVRQILPRYHAAAEKVWGEISAGRAHQLVNELARVCANAQGVAGDGRTEP